MEEDSVVNHPQTPPQAQATETEGPEDVDSHVADSSSAQGTMMDVGVQHSDDFESKDREDPNPVKRLKLDPHQTLHEALSSKDWDTVGHLLDSGEKPCSTDGMENCFILITKFGNCDLLERVLIIQPSAIHCRGPNEGLTLLMYAKDVDTLKTLYKFGPDLNARNKYEANALINLFHNNEIEDIQSPELNMLLLMAHYIIDQGIDVNATDDRNETALGLALELKNAFRINRVDQLIEKLLNCQPNISQFTSTDQQRVLKFARRGGYEPKIFEYIIDLLEHGLDAKIRDSRGNNLMCNVIKSYHKAKIYAHNQDYWAPYAKEIALKCLSLLRHGCELAGLWDYICARRNRNIYFKAENQRVVWRINKVNVLALLLRFEPFSELTQELLSYNLKLEKNKKCISELTYLLLGTKWFPLKTHFFELLEKTVHHLLACGVNVLQQSPGSRNILGKTTTKLEKKILSSIPDSLWLAGQNALKFFEIADDEIMAYEIPCKILLALLRFWPYPPLILFIFIYNVRLDPTSVMTMLQFLTRVGGILPQGSPLFKCLRNRLLTISKRNEDLSHLPELFGLLHANIPSLKDLCRPVLRASISKITTSGLDFSSLRVLCQGKMRELPRAIEDYLNFKDLPVFCQDDLY